MGKKCTTVDFRFKKGKWYFLKWKNYCTTCYLSLFSENLFSHWLAFKGKAVKGFSSAALFSYNPYYIQSLTIAIVFELIYYTNGHSRV